MKKPQTRILRVGVAFRGKIIAEQLVHQGRPVTLGSASDCTLSMQDPDAPRRHVLFSPQKGGLYTLHLPPQAQGRVASATGAVDLAHQGPQPLELGETDRGKIRVGETTILFQFVAPPPELLAGHRGDFRPRLIDEDDPVFLGFLGTFTAAAAAFLVLVATTPVRESLPPEELPERFVELAFETPEVDPPEPPEAPDEPEAEEAQLEGEPVPTQEAEPEVAESDRPDPEPQSAETPAEHEQRVLEEVQRRSLVLSALLNTGEGDPNNPYNGVFSASDRLGGDLDEALKYVNGVALRGDDNLQLQEGHLSGREDATIGDLQRLKASNSEVSAGPRTQVRGSVLAPEDGADLSTLEDGGDVLAVIRKNSGEVRACYERALKLDPTIQGRIEVIWTMSNGRVRSASIFSDTTGSEELKSCVVRSFKLWRFPEGATGEAIMPFVLTPQN